MAKPKRKPKLIPVSKLDPERELMGNDVDLDGMKLQLAGHGFIVVDDLLTDADVDRTIEGASTITLTMFDQLRSLHKQARFLGDKVDIEIDGLWFRLVKVGKTGDTFTMTFEDREVAVLRKKVVQLASWGKTTRTNFCKQLVRKHIKEMFIPINIPELKVKKVPKNKKQRKVKPQREADRDRGLPTTPDPSITIKGKMANKTQLSNCEEVLDVGTAMKVKRKLLVCAIMTGIQEATCYNKRGGGGQPIPGGTTGVGFFQQIAVHGWPATGDLTVDGEAFFRHAIVYDRANPKAKYGDLCWNVQLPAEQHRSKYETRKLEAEMIVAAYGNLGGDNEDIEALFKANLQFNQNASTDSFQYYCGTQKNDKWTPEGIWECLGRLMEEVNWRRFMVSGKLNLISEVQLFRSKPRMRITENTPGVDWIDYDYDIGKSTAEVKVQCRCDRWIAPPGTTVHIADSGICNGRWLVSSFKRSLFSTTAEITMKKPRPRLAEPKKPGTKETVWPNLPFPGLAPTEEGKIDLSGGAKTIVDSAVEIAKAAGGTTVYAGSGLRSGDKLPSGNYSDHAQNNKYRAARDIGVQGINLITGPPSPKLDLAVVAIGKAFGKEYSVPTPGVPVIPRPGYPAPIVNRIVDTFTWNGYRIQIIWRTPEYGGHMGHIHIGVLKNGVGGNELAP
jgi:hypothetical protein